MKEQVTIWRSTEVCVCLEEAGHTAAAGSFKFHPNIGMPATPHTPPHF